MKTLPTQPNLDFLRREAQTLKARHRARDEAVCQTIGHFDTSFHTLSPDEIFSSKFSTLDAQRVTARQYSFASWTRLKLFVEKATVQSECFNSPLREELLKRKQAQDAIIRRGKKKKWKKELKEYFQKFNSDSGQLMQVIYQQYGWPGPNIVGIDGCDACFHIAASCVNNSSFQYNTVMMMEDALPKGECSGAYYATIIDRWLCLSYKPTLFGSINDYNKKSGKVEFTSYVVDPDNLNKRRAEVGLLDFEASIHEFNKRAIEQKWPKHQQADWENMKRKLALEGGYIKA